MDQGTVAEPHALPSEAVLEALSGSPQGLSTGEAARRLAAYGRNELPSAPPRHPLQRFLAQFNNPLIYVLLASASAAAVLGHAVDCAVIVLVVLVNAIVGFLQEGKAEDALAAIRGMISPKAHVVRNGERETVPAAEIVPGDVVIIEPGDRVPADLRLIRARGLLIDEAVLTGESLAAEKSEDAVAPDAVVGDRHSMAFSGTLVAAGQGLGVVTATGLQTEIGRVSVLLRDVTELTTPLLRQISRFSRRFTAFVLAASVLLFAFAILVRGYTWDAALMAVVALAVGLIPEGLPAVITITLAIGVQRMAARNAVVRKLPAVEALGATSVICTDKTGTLTRNEMTARRVVVAAGEAHVTGSGYDPRGEIVFDGCSDDGSVRAQVAELAKAGLLCNDARLETSDGRWSVHGDPIEGALIALAHKAGLDVEELRLTNSRQDEIPFDAQHRFMATLTRQPGADGLIVVKGAPERVLDMSGSQAGAEGPRAVDHAYWSQAVHRAAAQGERVLGFAAKFAPPDMTCMTRSHLGHDFTFLGVVGFVDPPREEAIAAIADCQAANIDVKMITGDHAATAAAIGMQLGLGRDGGPPSVLTGRQMDELPQEALAEKVWETDVFARTSPEHKLRIVRALQSGGAIVAMTGDGVNDAPSLKQADVGIAMGNKGTEAAKEASQMVLLDDNFASIAAAVQEGRTVYDNIQKVTAWTLPTNGGEFLTVVAAILVGFPMPMTPVQILWVNLISTITLGLVLAFEPAEPGVMRRPPRPANAGLLSPLLVWRIAFVSLVFVSAALFIFFTALSRGADLELARTMVVNTMIVLGIAYLFSVRFRHMTSLTWQGALGTQPVLIALTVLLTAQLAFTYLPAMQALFATRPIAFANGLLVIAVGAAAFVLFEIEKAVVRRYRMFEPVRPVRRAGCRACGEA